METLKKLYEENDYPRGPTLLKLAKTEGLDVNKKKVDEFLASQASKVKHRIESNGMVHRVENRIEAKSSPERTQEDARTGRRGE